MKKVITLLVILTIFQNLNVKGQVTMTIDSVSPGTICAGNYLYVYWHLSDTISDGSYLINLSTASGTFPGTDTWPFNILFPDTIGMVPISIPYSTPAGTCYKIRIDRTSPAPIFTGIASACFTVNHCPNVITTLQPAATFDTNAVCLGSAVDVPFYSTGTYSFNTYTAELSDSSGAFPVVPNVIGSSTINNNTYDASLGSPPGIVVGRIPNVPTGCNYYIRVTSSSPVASSAQWGPFCIGHCDITTGNNNDLHFCVTDCAIASSGDDTTITIGVHSFGAGSLYNPGNVFTTQLLSTTTLTQIGANGIMGTVIATSDTTLRLHIPCKDSLAIAGVPIGDSYLRVVATNSTTPDNSLGSLIRISIGAPRATTEIISSYDFSTGIPKDTFCVGGVLMLNFQYYNYSENSTYMWQCPDINGGNPFTSPSGANSNTLYVNLGGAGLMSFNVQETSFGCVGAWSPTANVDVQGPPAVTITGPSIMCQGDTVTYSIPFSSYSNYTLYATGGKIIDTLTNSIRVIDTVAGSLTIYLTAINQCGTNSNSKVVTVNGSLPVNFTITPDSSNAFTRNMFNGTPSAGVSFHWDFGDGGTSSAYSPNHTFGTTSTYNVCLTATHGPCSSTLCHSAVITGITSPCLSLFNIHQEASSTNPNAYVVTNLSYGSSLSYLWDFGDSTTSTLEYPTHTYWSTGPYQLCLTVNNGVGCVQTYCDSVYAIDSLHSHLHPITINVVHNTAGINEVVNGETITLFPNPVSSTFTISSTDKIESVILFDVLGKLVNSKQVIANSTTIDLSSVSKGIYFVEIKTEKGIVRKKVVKD
jgi:PKD repeat protein